MSFRVHHFALVLAAVFTVAAAPTRGALAQNDKLPDGPGKAQLIKACTRCHTQDLVTAQRRTPEEWSEVMTRMVELGTAISDDEQTAILAYLNAHYGKGAPTAASAGRSSKLRARRP